MCRSVDVQLVKCGCKYGLTSAFYPMYAWQLALIVNDWIFVIVRWMSSLTYDVVEHSQHTTKQTCTAKCCFVARRSTHTK